MRSAHVKALSSGRNLRVETREESVTRAKELVAREEPVACEEPVGRSETVKVREEVMIAEEKQSPNTFRTSTLCINGPVYTSLRVVYCSANGWSPSYQYPGEVASSVSTIGSRAGTIVAGAADHTCSR